MNWCLSATSIFQAFLMACHLSLITRLGIFLISLIHLSIHVPVNPSSRKNSWPMPISPPGWPNFAASLKPTANLFPFQFSTLSLHIVTALFRLHCDDWILTNEQHRIVFGSLPRLRRLPPPPTTIIYIVTFAFICCCWSVAIHQCELSAHLNLVVHLALRSYANFC